MGHLILLQVTDSFAVARYELQKFILSVPLSLGPTIREPLAVNYRDLKYCGCTVYGPYEDWISIVSQARSRLPTLCLAKEYSHLNQSHVHGSKISILFKGSLNKESYYQVEVGY
jgi:hypothetical protein